MIKKPVDPPTHPDCDEGDRRVFVYFISEDRTHYVFVGESEGAKDLAEAVVTAPYIDSERVANAIMLWWFPGEKCSIDGLPYPPSDVPPYEGLSTVDGFEEECEHPGD